jgi:hypothetical protein
MFTAQLTGPERRPMGMNSPLAVDNQQLVLNLMHWLSRAEGMSLDSAESVANAAR